MFFTKKKYQFELYKSDTFWSNKICHKPLYIEGFEFEWRKVVGFAFTTLRDWFKKLAPISHLIRS